MSLNNNKIDPRCVFYFKNTTEVRVVIGGIKNRTEARVLNIQPRRELYLVKSTEAQVN